MTRIAVVTPVYNGEALIEDTLKSVLNQAGVEGGKITYIVCDGASTDKTVEIARSYTGQFALKGINYSVVSEPDRGMYDALAKGYRLAGPDHEIFAYINAGDYYSPYAFQAVHELIPVRSNWITGLNVLYDSYGHLIRAATPLQYPNEMIRQGFFGTWLPFIQQESTFWSRKLHEAIDLDALSKFKLAGDFYLWKRFAGMSELDIVECWLGGFRVHEGQLSSHQHIRYMQEFEDISDRRTLKTLVFACYMWLAWKLPYSLRRRLNSNILSL